MLQLRGELLKAMGEVLVKHGRLMAEGHEGAATDPSHR
jgi:hypothetical protein